ncbi:MAG: DNA polymerase III subunit delta [Gammaproteobacteria bacterium]
MKITPEQLANQLKRQLLPVYLIAGEEVLFVEEARANIKQAAKAAGFLETLRFTVETGFNWQEFQLACQNGSLFSDQQIIELHLSSLQLKEEAKKILLQYVTAPNPQKLLLVITPHKPDKSLEKLDWVKALQKIGALVAIWPMSSAQCGPWATRRLQQRGLQIPPAALQLLLQRTEGHLLALAQEIEKLALFHQGELTLEQVKAVSSENACLTVFDLIDVLPSGKTAEIVRTFSLLRQVGVEPILILWALTRELRQLIAQIEKPQAQKASSYGWQNEKRQMAMRHVLARHTLGSLQQCLCQAGEIDQMIKGALSAKIWEHLLKLTLAVAGIFIL